MWLARVVHHSDYGELHLGVVQFAQAVLVRREHQLVLASPAQEQVLDGSAGRLGHLVDVGSAGDEVELDIHAHAGCGAQGVQSRP